MCGCCGWRAVSRRSVCRAVVGAAACVSITAAGRAAERDALVEPRLRLADVPAERRVIARQRKGLDNARYKAATGLLPRRPVGCGRAG